PPKPRHHCCPIRLIYRLPKWLSTDRKSSYFRILRYRGGNSTKSFSDSDRNPLGCSKRYCLVEKPLLRDFPKTEQSSRRFYLLLLKKIGSQSNCIIARWLLLLISELHSF